jgi:DNA-binding LytR/AlgR family response regulator
MKMRVAVLFATAAFAAASAAQAQDVVVKPQQTVQFKANAYGCLSKDKLDAVRQHEQAGEQQQMQEYFSGFQCLSTPENANFRVVRVVGHDVEFVNAANSDTEGLWTNDRFIKQ